MAYTSNGFMSLDNNVLGTTNNQFGGFTSNVPGLAPAPGSIGLNLGVNQNMDYASGFMQDPGLGGTQSLWDTFSGSAFDKTNVNTGVTSQGWLSPTIGAISGIGGLALGVNQLNLGKEQLATQKSMWQKQFDMQQEEYTYQKERRQAENDAYARARQANNAGQ